MTVVQGLAGVTRFRVSGEGYQPKGEFFIGDARFDARADADASLLLEGALACNDAKLEEEDGENAARIVGDPTEGALLVVAAKAGHRHETTVTTLPRVAEIDPKKPIDAAVSSSW